jgi:hypothetical protein
VTILFSTDRDAAEHLMEALARDLQERGLADLGGETEAGQSYPLSILAGFAEGRLGEEVDLISERAKARQQPIARFHCAVRG